MTTEKELDYIYILKAVDELPFSVGKELLINVLLGKKSAESIVNNKLHKLSTFGSLAYSKEELLQMIDKLIYNKLLDHKIDGKMGWKVLELTPNGKKELEEPTKQEKITFEETQITEKDREIFNLFGEALEGLNDEQKKALISTNNHILCIAGAGSGKTTVLTKRIQFLIQYRSVDPSKILAITFTRKARQEMMNRLAKAGFKDIAIETFNSFGEKILREYNNLIYDNDMQMISRGQRYQIVAQALNHLNIDTKSAIDTYFSRTKQNSKTDDELLAIFVHDCFFIRDHYKVKNKPIEDFSKDAPLKNRRSAEMMYKICTFVDDYMKQNSLRDFTDQIVDAINLFKEHPDTIPEFDHILVDEYQDVNAIQVEFIELLGAPSLFCVGDPRQSIFGWRGSDIRHILEFTEKYPEGEVISLTTNYRSTSPIVNLINKAIEDMGLPDLIAHKQGEKKIQLHDFADENVEMGFVANKILESKTPREEIFVLARTNRQLRDLSVFFKMKKINHVVRSDEVKKLVLAQQGEVTLATIHAIKGLEANCVFVIGCNSSNFPCRASEHPVLEMVRVEEYDKQEEERRLFYVALSRARETLYLSYSGKYPTYFLTHEMLNMIGEGQTRLAPLGNVGTDSQKLFSELRNWRLELSREHNIAPYKIFSDKTLMEIAEKMPLTKMELGAINGIGPYKTRKYGEEIINIVLNVG